MHITLPRTKFQQNVAFNLSRFSVSHESSGIPEIKPVANDQYIFILLLNIFPSPILEKCLVLILPLMSLKFPKEGNWKHPYRNRYIVISLQDARGELRIKFCWNNNNTT